MAAPNTPGNLADTRPLQDEADIGSGEKTAADEDTEAIIRAIPPLVAEEHRSRDGVPAQKKPDAPG